jgi:hypothetical protein
MSILSACKAELSDLITATFESKEFHQRHIHYS